MPIWKFTTKMKRTCNGVFIEKGMTVDVVLRQLPIRSTALREETKSLPHLCRNTE